jgi:hypothetical protein
MLYVEEKKKVEGERCLFIQILSNSTALNSPRMSPAGAKYQVISLCSIHLSATDENTFFSKHFDLTFI